MALFGWFSKEKKETLDKGLEKTKESFFGKLTRSVVGKSKVDEDVLDELEEIGAFEWGGTKNSEWQNADNAEFLEIDDYYNAISKGIAENI